MMFLRPQMSDLDDFWTYVKVVDIRVNRFEIPVV